MQFDPLARLRERDRVRDYSSIALADFSDGRPVPRLPLTPALSRKRAREWRPKSGSETPSSPFIDSLVKERELLRISSRSLMVAVRIGLRIGLRHGTSAVAGAV